MRYHIMCSSSYYVYILFIGINPIMCCIIMHLVRISSLLLVSAFFWALPSSLARPPARDLQGGVSCHPKPQTLNPPPSRARPAGWSLLLLRARSCRREGLPPGMAESESSEKRVWGGREGGREGGTDGRRDGGREGGRQAEGEFGD